MKSFIPVMCLIVAISSVVIAEDTLSSLYSRRLPAQSEYQARNLQAQMVSNQQEHAQAQHARSAQSMQSTQEAYNARAVNAMMRQVADEASRLVRHMVRSLNERLIAPTAAESAQGQAFSSQAAHGLHAY